MYIVATIEAPSSLAVAMSVHSESPPPPWSIPLGASYCPCSEEMVAHCQLRSAPRSTRSRTVDSSSSSGTRPDDLTTDDTHTTIDHWPIQHCQGKSIPSCLLTYPCALPLCTYIPSSTVETAPTSVPITNRPIGRTPVGHKHKAVHPPFGPPASVIIRIGSQSYLRSSRYHTQTCSILVPAVARSLATRRANPSLRTVPAMLVEQPVRWRRSWAVQPRGASSSTLPVRIAALTPPSHKLTYAAALASKRPRAYILRSTYVPPLLHVIVKRDTMSI
jgi:hypothetical protein